MPYSDPYNASGIPLACVDCYARCLVVAGRLVDHTGQRHFEEVSRIGVDWPRLRAVWFAEERQEAALYASRGEGRLLPGLRSGRPVQHWCLACIQKRAEKPVSCKCTCVEHVPELDEGLSW
jgi:hypothetical protein